MPRYVVVYPDSPEARALLEREMAASLRGRRIGCSSVGSAAVAAEIRPEPRSLIERKRRELTAALDFVGAKVAWLDAARFKTGGA